MNKLSITIIAIVVLAVLGFFIFKSTAVAPIEPDNVAVCTKDAKQCPDGSYVGRIGPKCEFALCPSGPTEPSSKSGISGRVTLSPTCPVETVPPDPKCAPKPYATSIYITKSGSDMVTSTIESNSNGSFSIELGPGTYTLQAQGGKIYPTCGEVTVSVKSGQYTTANMSCDTGIR